MLTSILTHWKSSLFGLLGAAIVATAATANLDKMTPGQIATAFGLALVTALKGLVSADASVVTANAAK